MPKSKAFDILVMLHMTVIIGENMVLLVVSLLPPKDMTKSYPPEPVNMTLFGNRVFADVIKLR